MLERFKRCKHCGERVEEINFALGPEWRHWPSPYGNYRTNEKYRYCITSAFAEPEQEPGGSQP